MVLIIYARSSGGSDLASQINKDGNPSRREETEVKARELACERTGQMGERGCVCVSVIVAHLQPFTALSWDSERDKIDVARWVTDVRTSDEREN